MLYLCSAKRKKEENRPRSPLKLVSRKSSYYSLAAQTTTSTAVKLLLQRSSNYYFPAPLKRNNARDTTSARLPVTYQSPLPLNIKSNLYTTPPPEPARNVNMLKSVLILP